MYCILIIFQCLKQKKKKVQRTKHSNSPSIDILMDLYKIQIFSFLKSLKQFYSAQNCRSNDNLFVIFLPNFLWLCVSAAILPVQVLHMYLLGSLQHLELQPPGSLKILCRMSYSTQLCEKLLKNLRNFQIRQDLQLLHCWLVGYQSFC